MRKGSGEPRPKQRASSGTAEEGHCFCFLTGSLPMQRPGTNPTFSSKLPYPWSFTQCQEKKQLLCKESSKSEGREHRTASFWRHIKDFTEHKRGPASQPLVLLNASVLPLTQIERGVSSEEAWGWRLWIATCYLREEMKAPLTQKSSFIAYLKVWPLKGHCFGMRCLSPWFPVKGRSQWGGYIHPEESHTYIHIHTRRIMYTHVHICVCMN